MQIWRANVVIVSLGLLFESVKTSVMCVLSKLVKTDI